MIQLTGKLDPKVFFFHKHCRAALAVQRGLQQAKRHQEAEQKQVTQEMQTQDTQQSEPSVVRCSRSKGLIHDKNLCVWCMSHMTEKIPTHYVSSNNGMPGTRLRVTQYIYKMPK